MHWSPIHGTKVEVLGKLGNCTDKIILGNPLEGVLVETHGQKVQHSRGFSPDEIVDLNLSRVIWKVPLLKHQHHTQYGNNPLVMRGTQEMSLSEEEANSCLPSRIEYSAHLHGGSRMPAPFKRCFFLPTLVHMRQRASGQEVES